MLTRIFAAILALFAAGVVTTPLRAHPTLKSASPAIDGRVAAPTEIKLRFSENVILKFSSVELKDQAGKTLTTGELTYRPEKSQASHCADSRASGGRHLHRQMERRVGGYPPSEW